MLPLFLAVAALVAGQPITVSCDIPDSSPTYGYTIPHSGGIHLHGSYCAAVDGAPDAPAFGAAVETLVHESAHAAGARQESCAQWWVYTLYPAILQRFWGIAPGSALEQQISTEIDVQARRLPPWYIPAPCTGSDPSPPSLPPPAAAQPARNAIFAPVERAALPRLSP
jgi:hypothetical protein